MWFTTITIRIRSWNWIGISSLVVCRQSKYILIFLLPDDDFIRCDLSQLYSQLLLIRHCNVFYIRILHVYFFRETFPKLKSFSQKLMFASNSNRKYIMVAGCFMHMPVYVCVCAYLLNLYCHAKFRCTMIFDPIACNEKRNFFFTMAKKNVINFGIFSKRSGKSGFAS